MKNRIRIRHVHKDGSKYTARENLAVIATGNVNSWTNLQDHKEASEFEGSEEEAKKLLDKIEKRCAHRYNMWKFTQ